MTNDKNEFADAATKAVEAEVANYHNIYPELKANVWQKELNGFQCVIMPVFKPIQAENREGTLSDIRNVLKDKFRPKMQSYHDSDRAWRHVGKLDGEVYLFDLADLDTVDTKPLWDEYAVDHEKKLLGKCPKCPPTNSKVDDKRRKFRA